MLSVLLLQMKLTARYTPQQKQDSALSGVHCSKNEVQWLLRKLIGMHVLREDTYRQDNQYGNVVACLKINRREADAFLASSQPISMPYLVPAKQAAALAAKKAGMSMPPVLVTHCTAVKNNVVVGG